MNSTKCRKPYVELASLGMQIGGYACRSCNAKFCDHCGYLAETLIGRHVIICPSCGSENVHPFRLFGESPP